MPDPYLIPAVVSSVGTLVGAFGGIALTSGFNARQDGRRFREEESRAAREREDREAEARRAACVDLLGAAAQLRMQLRTLGSRHWADMNVKLAAAQEQATSIGLYASRVALLVPGDVAEAATALSVTAGEMAAQVAKDTRLTVPGTPADVFLGGQLKAPPDLADLDARITTFRLAAGAMAASSGT
jgi:hypothetical protein